jgi:hypothetical protein
MGCKKMGCIFIVPPSLPADYSDTRLSSSNPLIVSFYPLVTHSYTCSTYLVFFLDTSL